MIRLLTICVTPAVDVRSTVTCRNLPPVHPWDWTKDPWERLHIDFAGPFMNSMFLIIVDAHSKWLEIFPMKTTTTSNTIEKLRILFSQLGLPKVIVSNNGPKFVSDEVCLFVAHNGIKHITFAPYHPRTNGQAERLVQVFKQAMRSAKEDHVSLQQVNFCSSIAQCLIH